MSFIRQIEVQEATGDAEALYERTKDAGGSVPNYVKAFSRRPHVYAGWEALNGAIKSTMDLRRYELVTLASARALRSSYCSLAHGNQLRRRFLGDDGLERLLEGDDADLSELDVAVMAFAEKVTRDPVSVRATDIQALRDLGLAEEEVVDVVLASAARNFFSRTLDALGTLADAAYAELPGRLRDALTVGRGIAPGDPG